MPLDSTTMLSEVVQVPMSQIVCRPALYPRERHCPLTVERYASLTTKAPPIWLNQHHELIDGRHRMLAALERGETTISAIVIETRDDNHLIDLAVEVNFDHGLPLSQDDKQRLAVVRYDPSAGDLTQQKRTIAEWLRVHVTTVCRWLESVDHQRRELRHDRIREHHALGWSQRRIADEVGCSVGQVNNVLRSEIRRCELLNDCPSDFVPELYNEWRFTSNDQGIDHFGKTDPRIIENLVWRYARTRSNSVLDLFSGSGTVVDVCRKWERPCFAFDRRPRPARAGDIERHDILVDGLLPAISCWRAITLAFLDPPYSGQAAGRYSDDPTDLAHLTLDEFERVIADLINALGTALPAGAAIALLIRNTQWHSGPEHRIRRHDRNLEGLVTLAYEREIYCPLGRNATPTERSWAEETRDCLDIARKLLIWRV